MNALFQTLGLSVGLLISFALLAGSKLERMAMEMKS